MPVSLTDEFYADLCAQHQLLQRVDRQCAILAAVASALPDYRSADELGEHVCTAALRMIGAKRAALVRWDGGLGKGEVVAASRGHLVRAGAPVIGGSQTACACVAGTPLIAEQAACLGASLLVYGGTELPRELGALAIVPLRGLECVTGAIVVEGDAPGEISVVDGRSLQLLGYLSASALDTMWELEALDRRARTDPLTGLANRACFEERLARIVVECDRFGAPASLITVDIDRLKYVNDTYGTHAGDEILKQVARLVADSVRSVDLCARYGGEEMALLLPHTNMAGATSLAERLRRQVEDRSFPVGSHIVSITISLGVATYPYGARTSDELFAAADRALYEAKRAGRNTVVCDAVCLADPG